MVEIKKNCNDRLNLMKFIVEKSYKNDVDKYDLESFKTSIKPVKATNGYIIKVQQIN